MIPVLYEKDATSFTTLGMGFLPSWIEDTLEVVEERNGEFYLQGELPVGGLHVSQLAIDRIILASPAPDKAPQPFRILGLSKPDESETVKVLAPHVSYQLTKSLLSPTTFVISGDVQTCVLRYLLLKGIPNFSNVLSGARLFGFESDITIGFPVTFDTETEKKWVSVREALGGMEGSVVDLCGGELEWDGWTVRLLKNRGHAVQRPIRYGRNLESLSFETNASNLVTAYVGYCETSDGGIVHTGMIRTANAGRYAYPRIQELNLTEHFQELAGEGEEVNPSVEDVRAATEDYAASHPGNLRTSITIKVVPADLQNVHLCDTLPVIHPGYDIQQAAKVVRTVYDPIKKRYKEVTVGEIQRTIVDTIAGLLRR